MSDTTAPPAPTPAPTPTERAAIRIQDNLVAGARSMPDLIAKAKVADPTLAAQLSTKAAIYSKTYYATALTPILAWAVARWGLGWDAETQQLVIYIVGAGTAWVMRTISKGRVKGVFSAGVTATSMAAGQPAGGPTP